MISVIIPIYNLGNYLSRCLDSLIAQDNPNYEVIMVNDGSNDQSEMICRKYEIKDSRFRLINKINGGVSSARNIGLQFATGEWIVFIDGDDIVDSQYLTLPEKTEGIDIIEKSYYIKSQDQILLSNKIPLDSIIETNEDFIKYYAEYIQSNSATLCNKIIRRNIIANQKFDETKVMGEDFLFFLSILARINRYYRMSSGAYYYIRRDSSASKRIDNIQNIRAKILFSNLNSVKQICNSNGIKELGDNLIYTLYFPYLLKLGHYLSFADWLKLFKLWCLFPWVNHSLMTKYQKHVTLKGFPKEIAYLIARFVRYKV